MARAAASIAILVGAMVSSQDMSVEAVPLGLRTFLPTLAHAESTVSGSICGAEVNSSRIAVAQAPASGTLFFTMRQGSGYLTVYVPRILGKGRYALEDVSTRWLRYEELVDGRNAVWGGTNGRTRGFLKVTGMTPSRVDGVISATLSAASAPRSMPTCEVRLSITLSTD